MNEISTPIFININIATIEILFQLIFTFVLVYFIGKKVYPNYLKYVEKRKSHINEQIDEAHNKKSLFEKNLQQQEEEIKKFDLKKEEILNNTKKKADSSYNETIIESKERSKDIIAKAESDAEMIIEDAKLSLEKNITDAAILISEKIIKEKISKEEEDFLIRQSLELVEHDTK